MKVNVLELKVPCKNETVRYPNNRHEKRVRGSGRGRTRTFCILLQR